MEVNSVFFSVARIMQTPVHHIDLQTSLNPTHITSTPPLLHARVEYAGQCDAQLVSVI